MTYVVKDKDEKIFCNDVCADKLLIIHT